MRKYVSGVLLILGFCFLNACTKDLTFEEAKNILSTERGELRVYFPSTEGTFIKGGQNVFESLATEGYVEIVTDASNPMNSASYNVRVTDKLRPYLVTPSELKIADIEVVDVIGIKRIPSDENTRFIDYTMKVIPNPIYKLIHLPHEDIRASMGVCSFQKQHDGWKLHRVPNDVFLSRTVSIPSYYLPNRLPVSAPQPAGPVPAVAPHSAPQAP